MPVATEVLEVVHDEDPKEVIWRDLRGWIDRVKPTSGDCVVCVYERPTKLRVSGLVLPENASRITEDKFQGVVGMIVKIGPEFSKHRKALGLDEMPKVGDWIAFRTGDCIPFTLGKRAMRLLQGDFIRMVLADPDCII